MPYQANIDASGHYTLSNGRPSHFTFEEFKCKGNDCSYRMVAQALIDGLEKLREQVGPIIVVSGIRCTLYNAKVGGEPASYHIPRDGIGHAADIATGLSQTRLFFKAWPIPYFLGIGVEFDGDGKKFHVDARPTAQRATWMYGRQGHPEEYLTQLVEAALAHASPTTSRAEETDG